MFPPSLLARLFVKGSLKNNENGFELRIKNIIDSGTLTGLGPLTVDDVAHTPDQMVIKIGDKEVTGDQVTREKPLSIRAMSEVRIMVNGAPLAEGEHKVVIQMFVREAGKIQFSVTEPLTQ